MSKSRFVREQLASHHIVGIFNSGEQDIDSWLRESALKASARDYSRTYVWHPHDDHVVAFFTLSTYSLSRDELPKKWAHGEHRVIPAVLLGKFALDLSLQGQGLSRLLIADVVTEVEKASQIAAARYLVVDALSPEVIGLYENFGFQRSLESSAGKNRLFARIKDLAKS
jgi:GNAT superfamily N-acetyltransferase